MAIVAVSGPIWYKAHPFLLSTGLYHVPSMSGNRQAPRYR